MAPDVSLDSQEAGNGHLRALLLDTGVGSKWSTRTLARGGLSHMTWYRLINGKDDGRPYLPDWETLGVIAETLRDLGATIKGVSITKRQIQQAYLLDKGDYRSLGYDTLKSGVAQADVVVSVITSLPAESQLQLLEDLVPHLPYQLQVKLLQTLAGSVAGGPPVEKREGEQHDDDGSGLRP